MNSIEIESQERAAFTTSLAQVRANWMCGEWELLVQLEIDTIAPHPERTMIALLVAAAHFQLNNEAKGRCWIRQASDWGAGKEAVTGILVAGIYNSLACHAAVSGDKERMLRCFGKSVMLLSPSLEPTDPTTRIVKELSRRGLLDEGGKHVQESIMNLLDPRITPSRLQSQITILRTSMELLQSELSIAQRRGQLRSAGQESEIQHINVSDANAKWKSDLINRATSQLGQDLWVLEKSAYKRNGYFVEFGATNGVVLSNTYLLEKEFGWDGLCAEPNPQFYRELQSNRSCKVSDACIGTETGEEVEFVFADAYGGMFKDADNDQHGPKRQAYLDVGETALLRTVSLQDFLTKNGAPHTIDYISIDTEGSEFSILKDFPFDRWNIHLFTIEHNFTPQRSKIRNLMEFWGYQCQEADFDDWYFRD